jgi:hypothetical protein
MSNKGETKVVKIPVKIPTISFEVPAGMAWAIEVEKRLTRLEIEVIGIGVLVGLHIFGADAWFLHFIGGG